MDMRRTPDPDEQAVLSDTVAEDRRTERRWAMDASDVLALLAGIFFTVVGVIALINLGFDGFPSEDQTEVAGLAHTHVWALASIVLGLFFLAGAGSWGRSTTTFASALTLVVGIVVIAANDRLDEVVATNTAYGWTAVIIGAVVLVAAIAAPTVEHRRSGRMVGRRSDRAMHA